MHPLLASTNPQGYPDDAYIVVDHRDAGDWRGTWFSPSFNFAKGGGRFIEMVAGRARILDISEEGAAKTLGLRRATPDEWAFVIGLHVCGQAALIKTTRGS